MATTYEDLVARARETSRDLGKYAAVVEITTYLSASPARMTVAVADREIVSHQRGGEFRGVIAQFYRGEPIYRPAAPIPAAMLEEPAPGELPF